MIAKTQSKVDQFLFKQQLNRHLKMRSLLREDSKNYKDAKATLDAQIMNIRDMLQTNLAMLPVKKAAQHSKSTVLV